MLLDDSIILTSLFVERHNGMVFAIGGVYVATLIQIGMVIYFGEKLNNIKYKKELTSFPLVVLAVLVFLDII
jgi:high-affinity Fe2+/Pb2+ permease